MFFYILFVIAAADAIKFSPNNFVALKNKPLISKCCYNKEPTNFTPIYDYTMVNSLCGVRKIVLNETFSQLACVSTDLRIKPGYPPHFYVVEETKLDVGIVGKPHTFKCHIGENDRLNYLWLNSEGTPMTVPPLIYFMI
jgi:hypothetical protein